MGYTHYWYKPKEIKEEMFRKIVDDFRKLLPAFKMLDIPLANGAGEGEPIINYNAVIFNGKRNCGHKKFNLTIPWPDDDVIPLFSSPNPEIAVSGKWFGGDLLKQRVCNGDCSYEAFYFPRITEDGNITEPIAYYDMNGMPVYHDKRVVGKVFNFCKTAFRPYDLAVISFLIIAKRYLGEEIIIRTDGGYQHWMDGFYLCQDQLGYGKKYTIERGELIIGEKPMVILLRNDKW